MRISQARASESPAPAAAPGNADRRAVDDGCFLSADDGVDETHRGGAIAETRTPRRLITETSFERDVADVLGVRAARAAADIALADIAVRGRVT